MVHQLGVNINYLKQTIHLNPVHHHSVSVLIDIKYKTRYVHKIQVKFLLLRIYLNML